jgi:hypothetical protein
MHIVFSLPVLGYVYSPFKLLPEYAFVARYVAVPFMILSGFWMWIQASPKKSLLLPLGVFLMLLGLVGPLPLEPAAHAMPPGTLRSISLITVTLFRVGLLVGLVAAIIGALRNRKLKETSSTGGVSTGHAGESALGVAD